MNIGEASTNSGLPAKTIRYYEDIGLIAPDRTDNGYRDFSETHLHKLAFLSRARGLGFRSKIAGLCCRFTKILTAQVPMLKQRRGCI